MPANISALLQVRSVSCFKRAQAGTARSVVELGSPCRDQRLVIRDPIVPTGAFTKVEKIDILKDALRK